MSGEPRQASLRRLRRFDVRPNRELGQNFLIDDNILGVIESAAELGPDDVVLEVGGAWACSRSTWRRGWAHLHVVEIDRALEAPLREALEPFPNATLHLADAVEPRPRGAEPAPGKVVANLPYGVAATVLLKSIAELPEATLWVAMVQREVAERLAAGPGAKTYGATSVLAQLSCEVRRLRRVPPTVFHPAPNVQSALVVLRRTAPHLPPSCVALVHAGFAHRRKALAGSLALAPGAPDDMRAGDPRGARGDRPAARRPRRAARARRLRRGSPGCSGRTGSPTAAAVRMTSPAAPRERAREAEPGAPRGASARRRPAPALLAVRLARPG